MSAKRVRIALVLTALTAFTSLTHAEVKDAGPSGFTVENSVTVPVDALPAWQALINSIDSWWPKDHTWWGQSSRLSLDAHAGGCFCELAGERQVQHMQVVFVDPPKLLRMIGGLGPLQGMGLSGAMEWRLTTVDAGTKITLRYRAGGYATEDLAKLATVVDSVQGQQLGGLAKYLRDGHSKPGHY